MGWGREVKKIICALLLVIVAPYSFSAIVCEGGWNKYGEWSSCLKTHEAPGLTADYLGKRPVDANRVGQVERVHKNIDGSITVWRHGSSDDEKWEQVDENTWERTR